jgi:hypothetical protein
LRAVVDAEAIGQQVAEITLTQRTREAMGHPERAPEPWYPQRGRQRDEREVGLRGVDRTVGVPLVGRRGGLRACGSRIGGRLRERGLQVNREQERNGREDSFDDDRHDRYEVNCWGHRARSTAGSPGSVLG